MRVTANQVTFARLLAIPALVALLYGGPAARMTSLLLGIAVGLTDLLDGYLARKYGPTVLGGLMDPIADKVFVAASLLALGDLGWVPWWLVHAVLLREMLVTALRSSFEARRRTLRSTYLAKVKTWVQMLVIAVATAFMLLPLSTMVTIIHVITGAAILVGLVVSVLLKRRWRGIWIFVGFFVAGVAVLHGLGHQALLWSLFVTVAAITWGTALDYVVVAYRELARARDFHALDVVRVIGAITIPVLAAWCLAELQIMEWALISLVCAEMFLGGLDNLLAHHGASAPAWAWAVRSLGASALLAAALLLPAFAGPLILAALAVTVAGTIVAFWRNRRFYLETQLREKPVGAGAGAAAK
jgi:CDP-diacylglycerol--glycerol-3-phosphate 3-phosphatidyltransferase